MSSPSLLSFVTWVALTAVIAPEAKPADETPSTQPEQEVIEAVIDGLRSGQSRARQAAISAAVEIGEPIVPALLEMVLDPLDRGSMSARQILQQMGEKARAALPRLLELAADKTANPSPDSRRFGSPRLSALAMLREMPWAAQEATPVLRKVAGDDDEIMVVRQAAVTALGGMAKEGIPTLRKLADGPEGALREKARDVLASTLQDQRIQTRAEYFAALVEADMFDRHVPDYLRSARSRSSVGEVFPLAAKVKAEYRARLKDKPDAQLARSLARMIQDELMGTSLQWLAPSGRGASANLREDPAESNETLAAVLSLGLKEAEAGSPLAAELGAALARLRLVQGDFAGMNAVLEQLGWDPLPLDRRPWLTAPPATWGSDIAEQWSTADEDMRSGDCGLIVRVEKDGGGLRGAHVLVKPAPESVRTVAASSLRLDAFLPVPRSQQVVAPSAATVAARLQALRLAGPVGASRGSWFGYDAADRLMTRYGVTDETGQVKFEKLPEQDVQIEVHVPTANFTEPTRGWELWMEVEPGKMKRATMAVGMDVVGPKDAVAWVELASGRTVAYPRLVVVPLLDLDLEDMSEADPETFELKWSAGRSPSGEKVAYEVEMGLSGPGQSAAATDSIPAIRSTRQIVEENHWAVGVQGVGGQRLLPGGIYFFRVVARDAGGAVLFRTLPKRVWTPWAERKSPPPYTGNVAARQSPIRVETPNRRPASATVAARMPKLSERVERYLRENPDAFEREYAQVGAAWLAWSDGDEKAASKHLEELVDSLPAGSVPQATARWLLDALENGEEPPETLKLVAPRALALEE